MTLRSLLWSFGAVSMLLLGGAAFAAGSADYRVLQRIELGGEGGWDYLTLDGATQRLFIARGTRVLVVDVKSGKQVGEIPDTPGVHGVALVPELGKGFISAGKANEVKVFELGSLKTTASIKVGENPDAITYDPASRRVFVFNGRSHDATVIDPTTNAVTATLPLGGKPEFAVPDGKGQVFVNLEDKAELLAIDSKKPAVAKRWPLAPCEEPSGLALDAAHKRLFAGCANQKMAVVDADSGKLLATLPIGEGVDGNAFDPERQLAFSSNGGDATLTVVHEDSPDKFTVVANVKTAPGARTLTVDPKSHRVYLVAGPRRGQTGKFELLVVGNE